MKSIIQWPWLPIETPTSHHEEGVYAVRLLSQKGVCSIPRFLGDDPEGLLTIGMSRNLERRRRRFLCGVEKGWGHSSGNILCRLKTLKAHRIFWRGTHYEFSFIRVRNRKQALEVESQLTNEYLERFGEAPPLTSVIPNRYAWRKIL